MNRTVSEFARSEPLTLGVELELQLVSNRDFDLTRAATDLLAGLKYSGEYGEVKLEITESMLEVSTLPRSRVEDIAGDLRGLRDVLVAHCARHNVSLSGGGAHGFHRWPERRICPGERFGQIAARYGYLAKQFTVFGQHIHVGCETGDQAIALVHALHRYVPHFIALSASSPFQDATDTGFDSSRLNAVSAFPLSGQAPPVRTWDQFLDYFSLLQSCGVTESIKDLYWDIRPKPEYGTVEIRVCDTPLSIERAAALAAFAQCLARWLMRVRPETRPELQAHVARFNKFQACRYGFDGVIADPLTRSSLKLRDDLLATLDALAPEAEALGCTNRLAALADVTRRGLNGARWLRETYARHGSHNDVVRAAVNLLRSVADPLAA